MQEHQIFPEPRPSEVERYCLKPLPQLPQKASSTASYESLLDHRVPSPFIIDNKQIDLLWPRAYYYSDHSDCSSDRTPSLSTGRSRSDSTNTIGDFPRVSYRPQSLLPPAIEFGYPDSQLTSVECRLSSDSNELQMVGQTRSPKRSATPNLLDQLSADLDQLKVTRRPLSHDSGIGSLSSEQSASSLHSDFMSAPPISASHTPGKVRSFKATASSSTKHMPSVTPPEAPSRHISPEASDLSYASNSNHHAVAVGSKNLNGTTKAHTPQRPRVLTAIPAHVQEISHFSDTTDSEGEDHEPSRLAKAKKSLGNIRLASRKMKQPTALSSAPQNSENDTKSVGSSDPPSGRSAGPFYLPNPLTQHPDPVVFITESACPTPVPTSSSLPARPSTPRDDIIGRNTPVTSPRSPAKLNKKTSVNGASTPNRKRAVSTTSPKSPRTLKTSSPLSGTTAAGTESSRSFKADKSPLLSSLGWLSKPRTANRATTFERINPCLGNGKNCRCHRKLAAKKKAKAGKKSKRSPKSLWLAPGMREVKRLLKQLFRRRC